MWERRGLGLFSIFTYVVAFSPFIGFAQIVPMWSLQRKEFCFARLFFRLLSLLFTNRILISMSIVVCCHDTDSLAQEMPHIVLLFSEKPALLAEVLASTFYPFAVLPALPPIWLHSQTL